MAEIQIKRKLIEEGLNKATDDLRDQIDDVRLLKQFVRETKDKIEKLQKSKKRTKHYQVQGFVMQEVKDMVKPYTVTKTGSFADVIAMKYMGGTDNTAKARVKSGIKPPKPTDQLR